MHSYSTDSGERRYIPFFLALGAILISFLLYDLLHLVGADLPWWGPPVDTMFFYGALYFVFDRYIWKRSWVHRFGIISRVPDLSGTWRGEVVPTPADGASAGLEAKTDVTISIRQTWSEIVITAETRQSKSRSLSASFVVRSEYTLTYEYLNEPSANAAETMHSHRGTARLMFDGTSRTLEGEYYSGRDRQTFGAIRVVRQ